MSMMAMDADDWSAMRFVRAAAVIAILLAAAPAFAQGGPPLITDDPDTPGPGYWEINVAAQMEQRAGTSTVELPRIDVNYGVGRRVQLKIEAPWMREHEDGQLRTGAGNAEAGVKYRFLGEEGKMIAWSIYPQVGFATAHSSVTKGLVDGGQELFLPTELTLEIAHLEINGEVGPRFSSSAPRAWEYGASTEGHVVPRLELLAELHGESRPGTRDELIVNVGGRPKLTKQVIGLLSAGRAFRRPVDERARLLLYAGLQFNLPGLYDFKHAARH